MRRTVLALFLLWSPCLFAGELADEESVRELEIVDPKDLLGERAEAAMKAAYAEFLAQVGEERIQLERAVVRRMGPVKWALAPRTGWVHPEYRRRRPMVRAWLCIDLSRQEGHKRTWRERFGEELSFVCACAEPSPSYPWRDPLVAACGPDVESAQQRYLLNEVFVLDRPGRSDGALSVEEGSWVRLGLLEGESAGSGAVPLGGRVLVAVSSREDGWFSDRIVAVDPSAGSSVQVLGLRGPHAAPVQLVPGTDRALILRRASTGPEAWWVDPTSLVAEPVTIPGSLGGWPEAVVGDLVVVRRSDGEPGLPLDLLDLSDGTRIAVPAPELPGLDIVTVGRVIPVQGGLLAFAIGRSPVEAGPVHGTQVTGTKETVVLRFDLAGNTWSELLRGLPFTPVGVREDGLVVGELTVRYRQLVAAWDPVGDRFLVSTDVCADGFRLHHYSADQAWGIVREPGAVLVRGFRVAPR